MGGEGGCWDGGERGGEGPAGGELLWQQAQ
jgi:hypothetical protein